MARNNSGEFQIRGYRIFLWYLSQGNWSRPLPGNTNHHPNLARTLRLLNSNCYALLCDFWSSYSLASDLRRWEEFCWTDIHRIGDDFQGLLAKFSGPATALLSLKIGAAAYVRAADGSHHSSALAIRSKSILLHFIASARYSRRRRKWQIPEPIARV